MASRTRARSRSPSAKQSTPTIDNPPNPSGSSSSSTLASTSTVPSSTPSVAAVGIAPSNTLAVPPSSTRSKRVRTSTASGAAAIVAAADAAAIEAAISDAEFTDWDPIEETDEEDHDEDDDDDDGSRSDRSERSTSKSRKKANAKKSSASKKKSNAVTRRPPKKRRGASGNAIQEASANTITTNINAPMPAGGSMPFMPNDLMLGGSNLNTMVPMPLMNIPPLPSLPSTSGVGSTMPPRLPFPSPLSSSSVSYPMAMNPAVGPEAMEQMIQFQSRSSGNGITHLTPDEQKELLAANKKKGGAKGTYNRKDKSLGLLCENFLKLYSSGLNTEICLDNAATSLSVERRRIYDIVNILESVDIVSRRGKNQYIWHGTTRLANAIRQLESAIVSSGEGFQQVDLLGVGQLNAFHPTPASNQINMAPPSQQITFGHTTEEEDEGSHKKKKTTAKKTGGDTKKEQSLGHLSQVFVQMFLSNDTRIVSLDDAGKWLLGGPVARPGETEAKAQANFKSRVRRLYDIANVFTSLELIEKIHLVQTRKPAFKWLGARVYPLPSSVPREAYTSDAPSRRPTNKLGFDTMFPMPMQFYQTPIPGAMQQHPPPVPRRSTIDTAQLSAAAAKATASTSSAASPSMNDLSLTSHSLTLPESLASLSASFEQFEAIQKRRSFEIHTNNASTASKEEKLPTATAPSTTDTQPAPAFIASSPPDSSNPLPLSTRTSSFARMTARLHQQSDLLHKASTGGSPSNAIIDPLLLAYARVPSLPSLSSSLSLVSESTESLSRRVGFHLDSRAYIRNTTDFLRQYRAACKGWQEKMPTFKALYIKHTLTPTTVSAPITTTPPIQIAAK